MKLGWLLLFFTLVFSTKAMAVDIAVTNPGLNAEEYAKVQRWIAHGVMAVENTLNKIPQQSLTFEVVKARNAREPVPWAQVVRGTPNKIRLHIDRNASLGDFIDDWTLYHEISHLYLPYLDYQSFWLNEGFASYLQYLAMYRSNTISAREFKRRVKNGLKRGVANHKKVPGQLRFVSENMWYFKAFRRVYWTGAAFFIEIDQQLIQQGTSLAKVIGQYAQCCLKTDDSGVNLMKELDKIANTQVFAATYQNYIARRDFPTVPDEWLTAIALHYGQ